MSSVPNVDARVCGALSLELTDVHFDTYTNYVC